MSRCLSERTLVRLHLGEASAQSRVHLDGCLGCQARYERLLADLQAIQRVLQAPPPPRLAEARGRVRRWRAWAPAGAMATAGLAVLLVVFAVHQPRGPQSAVSNGTVSSLAADVSAAVFTVTGADDSMELALETPYLQGALGSGWSCTGDAFLNGECNDTFSALFIDTDFGG